MYDGPRTCNTQGVDRFVEQLVEVIHEAAPDLDVRSDGATLAIKTRRGGEHRQLQLRSSLTTSMAARLIREHDVVGMVIADTIDSAAKRSLEAAGWSYWDRRGHLRLWMPELGPMLNDTSIPSFFTGADGPDPLRPVAGVGGISVALALLTAPDDPPGVRAIATLAEMAPSTISRARRHLMTASLIEADGTPLVPDLFWALSDAWVVEPLPVSVPPDGPGWALSGEAAAATYGAPVIGTRQRFYCSDRATFDPHRLKYRSSDPADAVCEIAMAPTPLVNSLATTFVHPVVGALDLSRDSRGRESLTDWTEIRSSSHPITPPAQVVWQVAEEFGVTVATARIAVTKMRVKAA